MKTSKSRLTKKCKNCKKEFTSLRSANRKFCCRACYEEYAQSDVFRRSMQLKIKRGLRLNGKTKIQTKGKKM